MQLCLRQFYKLLRQQNNIESTTEHPKRFEEIKILLAEQISILFQTQTNYLCYVKRLKLRHRRSIITITLWNKLNELYFSKIKTI